MTTNLNKIGTKILWQTEYETSFEQPILIIPYLGSISIEQNGSTICLMDEYVEEFIKALRKVVKEQNS